MQLHLFGATTPAGESFRQCATLADPSSSIFAYSRYSSATSSDLSDPVSFRPAGVLSEPSVWISFAPIWLMSSFFECLSFMSPEYFQNLQGVIACSSSSVITKRFATNQFDRDLVARLTIAENQLLATCHNLDIPCRILRPTLIYGRVGVYFDRNLSRLVSLMRRLPFLPLPADTGLRQPIHASQLAAVVLNLVRQLTTTSLDTLPIQPINLGGDSELRYSSMLLALQQSLPQSDPARRCRLLSLPNRLFYAAASPLLFYSPKTFEAVLRMGADLSGFTRAHELLKSKPQPFPVLPLI